MRNFLRKHRIVLGLSGTALLIGVICLAAGAPVVGALLLLGCALGGGYVAYKAMNNTAN